MEIVFFARISLRYREGIKISVEIRVNHCGINIVNFAAAVNISRA